jgi:viroplasmin and RNaseH domain-containing protein
MIPCLVNTLKFTLRVGAKYKSFTDLECALKKFQQDNYVQLYKRSSRKFGTGSKYKNMEVAESAAGLLIYKELDYSCIDGGKHFSSISSDQRPIIIYNLKFQVRQ